MRATVPLLAIGLLAGSLQLGCQSTPPPPRIPIPADTRGNPNVTYDHDPVKPMPRPSETSDADLVPPYDDQPLLNQRPPEQRGFVDAYNAVGRPRISVFVNRTLEGQIIPVNPGGPIAGVERQRIATTGVTVDRTEIRAHGDPYYGRSRESTDRFQSTGPGEYRESLEVYLPPGEYDEIQAKAIDYEAMEAILTDWLAANGQVTIISPTMARQRLSDEQVKELQEGRPQMLSELAEQLNADVLVQAQVRPTRQTREGLEVRVIVEAVNTRGGQSVGRAVVDVPPPLEKRQMNRYTRFLARKLMDDMTGAWSNLPPEPRDAQPAAPTTNP